MGLVGGEELKMVGRDLHIASGQMDDCPAGLHIEETQEGRRDVFTLPEMVRLGMTESEYDEIFHRLKKK